MPSILRKSTTQKIVGQNKSAHENITNEHVSTWNTTGHNSSAHGDGSQQGRTNQHLEHRRTEYCTSAHGTQQDRTNQQLEHHRTDYISARNTAEKNKLAFGTPQNRIHQHTEHSRKDIPTPGIQESSAHGAESPAHKTGYAEHINTEQSSPRNI